MSNQVTNISKKEIIVLNYLADGGAPYGFSMVRSSSGQLKLGTVYNTLSRMETKGLLVGEKEEVGDKTIPRRLYKLTEHGKRIQKAFKAADLAYNEELKNE